MYWINIEKIGYISKISDIFDFFDIFDFLEKIMIFSIPGVNIEMLMSRPRSTVVVRDYQKFYNRTGNTQLGPWGPSNWA